MTTNGNVAGEVAKLSLLKPYSANTYTFIYYQNLVYKNIQADILESLRTS